jgi:hypothetical protein
MGLRATVIKEYKIEYGDTMGFNYGAQGLSDIIYEFCKDFYVGDDGYGGCNSDAIWEVNKDEFAGMLEEIKSMSDEEFKDIFPNVEQDRQEVIRVFEGFLKETPEDNLYVRFGWL